MKATCEIIRDILPLYAEDLASPDSRDMVEEHLRSCEGCRRELDALGAQLKVPIDTDAKPLKKIRKTIRLRRTVSILLVLTLLAVGYWQYWRYHPHLWFDRGISAGDGYYQEVIMIVQSTHLGIEPAGIIDERIEEIWQWNDPLVTSFSLDYEDPRDIRASGEIHNGQTTLRYTGFATNQAGERVGIFEEKTFDFVICREDDFFMD